MTNEEANNNVILITAYCQCLLHLLDQLELDKMNPSIQVLFKDSKDIFKVVNKHLAKRMGVLYEEVYKVDPDTIETLIEATQYKFDELKNLKISDLVNIVE